VKIDCIGGGPAGLYFAILMKKADPTHGVRVFERNRVDDTFGFGVVFSDETLGHLREADPETYDAIAADFSHWDDIDVHFKGQCLRSSGHGFSGLARKTLLQILRDRCQALGVALHFDTDVPDYTAHLTADLVVAADGINSGIRDDLADRFRPDLDWRPNRFVWLGTTRRFPAFTFYFRKNAHGLFRVHAYNYDAEHSTFIVECTEETWRRAGLDETTEEQNAAYVATLFAEELDGHPLLTNRSIWRQFATVHNASWSHTDDAGSVVLLGDSAHTAHFSIGSGTKLAMEDAIALRDALISEPSVAAALPHYEAARRPVVNSTQRAAQVSLEWFEATERYFERFEPMQFAYSLLTRSMRINHTNLRLRDPEFTERVDTWFAATAGVATTPPMFTPLRLRSLTLANRIAVSPMCMYSAEEGAANDWHLVHLGSRAVGGAGLVMAEMTNASAKGRISPGCTGMYRDEHVGPWKRVVDFAHQHSKAAMGFQLGHAGRKGSTRRMWDGADQPLESGNWPLLAPSALAWQPGNVVPTPMNRRDMDKVTAEHVSATERAEAAGFDLLELHMAHGYLLAEFLSPLTNKRTDEYGGSMAARLKYPLEVLDAVRGAWPSRKPLSVRISAVDWAEGGNTLEDGIAIAAALKAHGVDIIDVSTGQTVPWQRPEYGRLYQTPFSEVIRLEVDIPTMTVGSISSYGDANAIIASGRADVCALARAHLFDPYWTRHAAYEQGVNLEWPPQYIACSRFTPRFEWSVRGNQS
jgi:anthraniloyl-CoA monooxygenase